MANDKWAGYTPDSSKQKREGGSTEINNRLDRINPYEFRKGMDYELTSIGCARLAESTIEEREKSTEIVLKNLEEHQAYYSALIQYTTGMNQAGQIDKMTFKKYLEENFPNTGGTGMQCVTKEFKNDKMTELKEAIKSEIKNILSESNSVDDTTRVKDRELKRKSMDTFATGDDFGNLMDKKPSKKDVKSVDKTSAVQIRKDIDDAKGDLEKAEKERSKHFAAYKKAKAKAKNDDQEASAKKDYVDSIKTLQDTINKKKAEIKKKTDSLTDLSEERKQLRREVAKMMMDKDTHMEILKIVKEGGVIMNEGSEGVKMYYEIAKTAYQEGFMAALDKNQD